MKQEDGSYKSIYCHWDGYPEYNGLILFENYKDKNKVEKLINLGDISSLDEEIEPDYRFEHCFSNRQEGITLAYHRDRGENINIRTDKNINDLINYISHSMEEYLYIYDNGVWKYAEVIYEQPNKIKIVNLKDELINIGIIDIYENEININI